MGPEEGAAKHKDAWYFLRRGEHGIPRSVVEDDRRPTAFRGRGTICRDWALYERALTGYRPRRKRRPNPYYQRQISDKQGETKI